MTTLSTHVLDAARGVPATRLAVTLLDGTGAEVADSRTDEDGRCRFDHDLSPGTWALCFVTGPWFSGQDRETFFPEVRVTFLIEAGRPHAHVALLLSPYACTTYRGS